MPSTRRSSLTGAIVALGAFLLAFGGGFLVGHEPQPDTISFRLEPPTDLSSEALHHGVVTSTDAAALEISTAAGAQRFDIEAGTPIEDLSPLGESPDVPAGVPINVGGERTESGYVLTGVVVIEPVP